MSTNLSFRLKHISGCVLKSNANRIKSRTAKFEHKKSKLAREGRSEISLVAKLILRLIFKRLHPRVSCLHPQRKMRKFRARWRSARANFFHAVLLVALVLLCDSVALKCGKPNKTTRKCAGKIYFLSKELARAAELQEGSAICRVHWDEIRRSNNRCSVPRENHSRGLRKQRIPAKLLAVLDAIGATCHVMSKWPLELLLSGSFYLNFHCILFTEEMVLMRVHSLLYCWLNFLFYTSLLFH